MEDKEVIEAAEQAVHENIQQFLDSYELFAGHQTDQQQMSMFKNVMKNLEHKIIDDIREEIQDEP